MNATDTARPATRLAQPLRTRNGLIEITVTVHNDLRPARERRITAPVWTPGPVTSFLRADATVAEIEARIEKMLTW